MAKLGEILLALAALVLVGLGAYDVAVVISLFTFLTLWLLAPFKQEAKTK